ncbi:MAG: Fe-S-containing hydro-lyase [Erysipelotrichaceae bacterium]|nr:Fe-S-containing hydro-lyase [Erysipelotrichaceae bacterium]
MIKLETPLTVEKAKTLHAGDQVLLSGVIYTGRDAAHKRFVELVAKGEPLPFDPQDQVIYYVGPTPAKPGAVIGSCGPTTSYRMDAYAPKMMELGLRGMIGKGRRNDEVKAAMRQYAGVYFGAIGGAGALIASCIKSCEIIAFEDLGTEAVRKLTVEDLPLTVVVDSYGEDLYISGREDYLKGKANGN